MGTLLRVTKSAGSNVGSRPSPYSHAKLALLIPATTKSASSVAISAESPEGPTT